jgi:hypothetical protein
MRRLACVLAVLIGSSWVFALPATPPPDPARGAAERSAVEQAIAEFGTPAIIDYLLEVRSARVTVEVDGKLRPAVGRPNAKLVTPASILHDLAQAMVDPLRLRDILVKRGPPKALQTRITQDDVGSASGSAESATATGSGEVTQDSCIAVARRNGAACAARKGCTNPEVTSVELKEPGDAVRHPRYLVTGACRTDGGSTGTFEATVKCFVRKLPRGATIESESGGKAQTMIDAASVGCSVHAGRP